MWRFIAGLHCEKKIKIVPHVFSDSAEVYTDVYTAIIKKDGNKNNLRTIKALVVQKLLKNNGPRPKFTGYYKKKSVYQVFFK